MFSFPFLPPSLSVYTWTSSSEGVPLVVLVMFSSQGDNIPEALQLATITDSWLKLRENSVSLCSHVGIIISYLFLGNIKGEGR